MKMLHDVMTTKDCGFWFDLQDCSFWCPLMCLVSFAIL